MDIRVSEALMALATPGSLEQVLDNLVSNALAVSKPGDTITVEGRRADGDVVLDVRDQGPGMTAEQRARAFDRFWRAGSPGGGTGLGLAIVHRLRHRRRREHRAARGRRRRPRRAPDAARAALTEPVRILTRAWPGLHPAPPTVTRALSPGRRG